jgi:hypothetical protein
LELKIVIEAFSPDEPLLPLLPLPLSPPPPQAVSAIVAARAAAVANAIILFFMCAIPFFFDFLVVNRIYQALRPSGFCS